ncbi:MAG TPA: DNA adenine methylase [Longimicrobiales bacterium]|nr:DNA adenine methylase [Longimicrobiales bacterium]
MRYIGNKTRLLGFIRRVVKARAISGSAVDPFSGTASVAQELKRLGFRVIASDIMTYGYVFARAYVQATRLPSAPGLADEVLAVDGAAGDGAPSFADVLHHLDGLDPLGGFVHRAFSPDGAEGREHGRMYFTGDNAARIDHIRSRLEEWRRAGRIDDDLFHLLLAALLEAADRVANTTGVYASFVKSWQPNARRRLRLRVPDIVQGNGCQAHRKDALALVPDLEPFDLLYLDPPYNNRQYPGYYHVPEIIAEGWFDGGIELRGKTGLAPDEGKRSDWSRAGKCEEAFARLVATAPWTHVVMSYNDEGIIPAATIERVLKENGRQGTYRRYEKGYKRYRSDADGEARKYKGDRVSEYLYCVSR